MSYTAAADFANARHRTKLPLDGGLPEPTFWPEPERSKSAGRKKTVVALVIKCLLLVLFVLALGYYLFQLRKESIAQSSEGSRMPDGGRVDVKEGAAENRRSGRKVEPSLGLHDRYEAMADLTLPSGDKMPWFGLGTWQLLKGKAVKSIRSALEMGYRMVDTAQMTAPDYDEPATGKALELSNVDRKKVFIVTKVDPFNLGYENTLKSIDGSLKNLGTDYIDLLLIHAPTCGEACEKEPGTWQETWRAMEELHRRGHVRNLGVSNFDVEQMAELVKLSTVAPAAVQNFFDPFHTDDKVRDFCRQHNIAYMGYTTLGFGYMGEGGFDYNPVLSNSVIVKISKRLTAETGKPVSAAQVVLRWGISEGAIMIPASSNENHQRENLDCLQLKLTEQDRKSIAGLAGTLEVPEEEDPEEDDERPEEDGNNDQEEEEEEGRQQERQEEGPEDEMEVEEEALGDGMEAEDEEDMIPTLQDLKNMAKEYKLGKTGKAQVHKEADLEESLLFVPLDGEDVASKLVVMKAETGEVLWTFTVYGHFGGAPVLSIDGKVVYFTSEDLHLYALRTVNGEILWDFHGDFCFLAEPVLGGNGALYVGDMSGVVYALQAKSGTLMWKKKLGKEGIWSRAAMGLEDLRRVVYVATLDTTGSNIFALDAASGDTVWKSEVDGAVTSALVMSPDLKTIFIGATGTTGKTKAKVFGLSTMAHSALWHQDIGEAADFSPAIARSHDGERLLVTHLSGNVVGLASNDGSVLMSRHLSSSGLIAAPLFVQDTMAVLTSTDGHLYEVRVEGNRTRALVNAGSPVWGRPVISSDGMIYFASIQGTLIAVEFGSSTVTWRKNLNGFVAASPTLL